MCDKRIEGCKTAPGEGIHALDIELSALLKWSKSRQPKSEVHIGVVEAHYQRPILSESTVKHHDIALNTEINSSEKPACILPSTSLITAKRIKAGFAARRWC